MITSASKSFNRKNVLILFGGCSERHDDSVSSAAHVISGMSDKKYNIIPVYITKEGKWLLYDGYIDNLKNIQWEKFGTQAVLSPDRVNRGLLRIVGDKAKNIPVDVAFPIFHGFESENGAVQGLLELACIPYVGCGILASALSADRCHMRNIVGSLGINQAKYVVLTGRNEDSADGAFQKIRSKKIGYPCHVKTAAAGLSVGMTVYDKKELDDAMQLALDIDAKIIVEKAVTGRRLLCGVLGSYDDAEASAIGEIIYTDDEQRVVIPADLSEEKADSIRGMALRVFDALDGKGFACMDFIMEDGTDTVFFDEINTMPELSSISMYPMMWKAKGVEINELTDRLMELALGLGE